MSKPPHLQVHRQRAGVSRALGAVRGTYPISSLPRADDSCLKGPTVARALAEQLYRNETYVLGVDSHCHFLR